MLFLKMFFLSCWKKLELGFVNVDHLLNQIHMSYDEKNGTSIIELVLKKMGNIMQGPEAMFIEDKLIEIKFREHIVAFVPDMQGLSPSIQNKKKRPFNIDLGLDFEKEEEVVEKKEIKNTEELAESVSDLIKIDTNNQKKREEKKFKKCSVYIQVCWTKKKRKK